MRAALSLLIIIYQIVSPYTKSPFHSVLKQNYIQSLRVLLNIIPGSVASLWGMRDDLFCGISRLVAFYKASDRSDACGLLSIPVLTGDKLGATKDRNLRSFYVSVSHAEGGAHVISGPAWGLPAGCS